jgi:hypothetical protein
MNPSNPDNQEFIDNIEKLLVNVKREPFKQDAHYLEVGDFVLC